MRRRVGTALVLATLLGLPILAAGCGSGASSDSAAVQAQIDRERADAAASAHQSDKLHDLQSEVDRLRRAEGHARTVVESAASQSAGSDGGTGQRTFHAPSGNVSCQVDADSARCAVASIDKTFVLTAGERAYTEPGAALARGAGTLADWETSVSVGSVTCVIPAKSQPRGIACEDASSGHGFEASRVVSRQRLY